MTECLDALIHLNNWLGPMLWWENLFGHVPSFLLDIVIEDLEKVKEFCKLD